MAARDPLAGHPNVCDHAPVRLLLIGDIVGRPGRELVKRGLAALVERYTIDFVIANAENAAGGFGITREIGDEILERGVDVMTSGNHIWTGAKPSAIGTKPPAPRPISGGA